MFFLAWETVPAAAGARAADTAHDREGAALHRPAAQRDCRLAQREEEREAAEGRNEPAEHAGHSAEPRAHTERGKSRHTHTHTHV